MMDDDKVEETTRSAAALAIMACIPHVADNTPALSPEDKNAVSVCLHAWVERIFDGQYDDDILLPFDERDG